MLYIKFDITDASKYADFRKLYTHMVHTRQPDYEEEEAVAPEFDWEQMNEKEMEEAFEKMNNYDPNVERYKKYITDDADNFLKQYLKVDKDNFGVFGFKEVLSIFNYLEYDFEVQMDDLQKLTENSGIVNFSTGNYPFGGIDRFLMTLKAFDLRPTEYYNGFSVLELAWISNFKYDTIELPKQTKAYLEEMK